MTPEAIDVIVAENASLKEENRRLRDEIAELKERVEWFTRQIYGQKSERYVPAVEGQTELDLGVAPTAQQPQQNEHIAYDRKKAARHTPHGREEIPSHLPRKQQIILPSEDVSGMEKIGEKVTEQVEYTAPRCWVRQIVRPVFAGVINGIRTVVCAELPPQCNEKGKFGASMISHVTTAKFEDHLPIYRLQRQLARDSGMMIPEATLDHLPQIAGFWLGTVADRLTRQVLESGYVQLDESTLRVMIKPTNGKSSTGYMWVAHSPLQRIVSFTYDRHRSGKVSEKILGSYRGILQTDCYAAYDRYSRMEHIIHAGCHAHARRGFDESMQGDKSRATYALELYRSLFAIEQEARTAGMDHARRLAYRQEKALPVLLAFKSWLDENVRQVKPKSAIGKAILYCLNHWNRLIRYLDDGRIEISNNLVENCIRPLAIGRKNWLFAGSESMAKMMGDIYTVQGTCKLHGINFFTYLTALLEELPNRTGTASAIDDLLPMNWKPEVQA